MDDNSRGPFILFYRVSFVNSLSPNETILRKIVSFVFKIINIMIMKIFPRVYFNDMIHMLLKLGDSRRNHFSSDLPKCCYAAQEKKKNIANFQFVGV